MLTSGSDCGYTFAMSIPQHHISGIITADQLPALTKIWKLLGRVAQVLTWEAEGAGLL